jgi:protein arginine kinase activator
MLCQYCGKNEATTHIKKIINGEKTEMHLCPECARALGYDDMFTGLDLNLDDFFGGFFSGAPMSRLSSRVVRCEKCGSTFEDIARTGTVGCSECYKTFYDKLEPSIRRIHGNAVHRGKIPSGTGDPSQFSQERTEKRNEGKIRSLKEELSRLVAEENFEKAAQIRDEIKKLQNG